ncbi:hypothetical protein HDU80_004045, partial [Chytriomyces hyalinus]
MNSLAHNREALNAAIRDILESAGADDRELYLEQPYLLHCVLGHISKEDISYEAFEKAVKFVLTPSKQAANFSNYPTTMGRKAAMNSRHVRMPTIHHLTLKPENINITKGKYVASRHHYLFDDDGKPAPVEGTELPVFLEDIPGMTNYSTDQGRHLFLEKDTGMFIAYFEADTMQKCFRNLARSIEKFECGTRNDVRGSSKRRGHIQDSKMVASGLKPCGERGLSESGVSPYKSAGSFVLSNVARQELAYQLLEVSKQIQWMETVGETERKEIMF